MATVSAETLSGPTRGLCVPQGAGTPLLRRPGLLEPCPPLPPRRGHEPRRAMCSAEAARLPAGWVHRGHRGPRAELSPPRPVPSAPFRSAQARSETEPRTWRNPPRLADSKARPREGSRTTAGLRRTYPRYWGAVRRLVPVGTEESVWNRPESSNAARYVLPPLALVYPPLSRSRLSRRTGVGCASGVGRCQRLSTRRPYLEPSLREQHPRFSSAAWGRGGRPPGVPAAAVRRGTVYGSQVVAKACWEAPATGSSPVRRFSVCGRAG